MREIPKLQILCLRAVGSQSCSAEDTFASDPKTGEPGKASQLLRAFHRRAAVLEEEDIDIDNNADAERTIHDIPLRRAVCVGKGSSRRANANDVDLNHPLIAHRYHPSDNASSTTGTTALVMEHGNPSMDCLQSYIDSLVELGRMDDGRLHVHFFEEWKANVLTAAGKEVPFKKVSPEEEEEEEEVDDAMRPRKRTRRRTSDAASPKLSIRVSTKGPPPPLGSLSLNNCAIGEATVEAMRDSGMGPHLGVLDLTGIYGLNDPQLEQLLPHCPNLTRLSLKNCRRLTVASLHILAQYQSKLQFLDVGGTYNINPDEIIETLVVGNKTKKHKPCPELRELHASGLGWNDDMLESLVGGVQHDEDDDMEEEEEEDEREIRPWKAISIGFSMSFSALGLRHALSKVSASLISLALHFCENVVDNALLGMLGRNLPHVRYLDVRGNPSLNSMTGWYDGRASADLEMQDEDDKAQELYVLARYTGISKSSLEETLRIHPLEAANLHCILDSEGAGVGIYR